jgi:hypothetical protein
MAVKLITPPEASKLPAIKTIADSLIFRHMTKKVVAARRPEIQKLATTILTHTVAGATVALKAPQLKLRKIVEDAIFRAATNLALESLDPKPDSKIFAIPIGIYLNTEDEDLISQARDFWTRALAEEGLAVIFEYEARGSWFKGIVAVVHSPKDRKALLSRLEKKGIQFAKKFKEITEVIALGTIFIGPAPPVQPPAPPVPIVCPATPQQARESWQETFKTLEEKTKSAGEGAGGLVALFDLLRDKKKDKTKDEKDKD